MHIFYYSDYFILQCYFRETRETIYMQIVLTILNVRKFQFTLRVVPKMKSQLLPYQHLQHSKPAGNESFPKGWFNSFGVSAIIILARSELYQCGRMLILVRKEIEGCT